MHMPRLLIFLKYNNPFRNTIRVSNSLDADQAKRNIDIIYKDIFNINIKKLANDNIEYT